MSARRAELLRRAAAQAAFMRRIGYPEAEVAEEYCIAGEIGRDRFYTETISIYAGPYVPPAKRRGVVRRLMEIFW